MVQAVDATEPYNTAIFIIRELLLAKNTIYLAKRFPIRRPNLFLAFRPRHMRGLHTHVGGLLGEHRLLVLDHVG